MADLSIRQVEAGAAEVLAACADLSALCFADGPTQQWTADQLAQHLSQNQNALFVAHVGNHLVGFALFSMIAGEGELLSICSDPAQRRAGHAKALLTHSLKAFSPQKLILEVAADNLAAICLYEGLGFAEIDRRKAYYSGPHGTRQDAIVMALSHAK